MNHAAQLAIIKQLNRQESDGSAGNFKQKTAYAIQWCDWSSDVCSSDLPLPLALPQAEPRLQLCPQAEPLPLALPQAEPCLQLCP